MRCCPEDVLKDPAFCCILHFAFAFLHNLNLTFSRCIALSSLLFCMILAVFFFSVLF